jgi:hypothetical protein
MPLKMKKGSEPRGVGNFRTGLTQSPKKAKQACRVKDELPLANVETPCGAERGSSPRNCRGFDLNEGDLG